jgi:hypothetical protein
MDFQIRQAETKRLYRTYPEAGYAYGECPCIGVFGNEAYILEYNNPSSSRVEVRFTVDGVDVLTGKPADLRPEGQRFVVEGGQRIALEAWPESLNGGGRFVFTQAGSSVAANTETGVGHIGVLAAAVFIDLAPPPVYRAFNSMSRGISLYQADSYCYNDSAAGTGVGEHVDQKIRQVAGLRQPSLSVIETVRYMWWDDLKAKFALSGSSAPWHNVPGFPNASRAFHGVNLSGVPRVTSSLPSSDPRFV